MAELLGLVASIVTIIGATKELLLIAFDIYKAPSEIKSLQVTFRNHSRKVVELRSDHRMN
jgi:hypothetical protein